MAGIYDRADIYDLFENEERYLAYKKHWEAVFQGKGIKTMLDVSIGSGSVTLPVLDLGVELCGSDLSETMLKNCGKKAGKVSGNVTLKCTDFRDLSCWNGRKFDCVASTGNSLPYVEEADVLKTLEQMDALVKDGGYLYFDLRNWEKIVREKERFFLYDPMFDGENRINVTQVWDYLPDGTVTFNILYTFEKDNRVFQKEQFEEHYHPVAKNILLDQLKALGYHNIEVKCFPAYFPMPEFERVNWYCVIAQKGSGA